MEPKDGAVEHTTSHVNEVGVGSASNSVNSTPEPPVSGISHAERGHKRTSSVASVAQSPLQQVNSDGASNYKLKVVSIYEKLFVETPHPPGYWIEFFLLPVHKEELSTIIRQAAPLSQHQEVVHTLLSASIANLNPQLPTDIIVNALGVLEVIICETLDLSTSPLIQVLAGVDRASSVFDELTGNLLKLLGHKSLRIVNDVTNTILQISRKIWGTALNTLFTSKNFFAAFIGVLDRFIDHEVAMNAFIAIGVLTAVNVYDDDGQSIYLQRVSDYVDEAIMTKIIALVQSNMRTHMSPSSSSRGISSWFSRWFNASATSDTDDLESKGADGQADSSEQWKFLLPLQFFVLHNSIFAQKFASSPGLVALVIGGVPVVESAQKVLTSYNQTWLIILILRHLVENEFLTLVDPAASTVIRIHASKLALDTSKRLPLAGILDISQIALRSVGSGKNPELKLLAQVAALVNEVASQMVATKSTWQYNWQSLWKTMLGLVKHLLIKCNPNTISRATNIITSLLSTVVGLSFYREILDEEDWNMLVHTIVQNASLFKEAAEKIPELSRSPSILAVEAMASTYSLTKESPSLQEVVQQGKRAAGNTTTLIGGKERPFGVLSEPIMQRIMKSQVKT